MDESGSAVGFSDAPNAKVCSFVCLTLDNTSYSVLWFDKDTKAGALVTRSVPAAF